MFDDAQTAPDTSQWTAGEWLRARLTSGEQLVLPGAYDALSAKLIAASGAEALYMGGYAATAGAFGLPDIGLLYGRELLDVYRRVRTASGLPMVVDIDTGYGGVLNVRRTVEDLVAAGLGGFHIEDQENPKRCGHLDAKVVVPLQVAVQRVEAAVETARDAGANAPVVIARTDALQPEGLGSAIRRVKAYRAVGADAIFVDAIPNLDTLKRIRDEVEGPLVFNGASTGRSPLLSLDDLHDYGYDVVLYPIELMLAALAGATRALGTLGQGARPAEWPEFDEINDLLGLPSYQAWEARFPATTAQRKTA